MRSKWVLGIVVVLIVAFGVTVFVGALVLSLMRDASHASAAPSASIAQAPAPNPTAALITMAMFNRLEPGMSYEQAVRILGAPGVEMSRVDLAGTTTLMYTWQNPGGSNMNAMFQGGRLVTKAQFGLP